MQTKAYYEQKEIPFVFSARDETAICSTLMRYAAECNRKQCKGKCFKLNIFSKTAGGTYVDGYGIPMNCSHGLKRV